MSALLVRSVDETASKLAKFDFKIGEAELFEGEGTKEIYIEHGKGNSLLLMEPAGPGAYRRALEKRGPGLHHIAIDVLDLESYIESLAGSGWLLHPMSVRTLKHQVAYLARPGFPGLIEVQQRTELKEMPLFVQEISISFDLELERLLKPAGLEEIIKRSLKPSINLGGHSLTFAEIF